MNRNLRCIIPAAFLAILLLTGCQAIDDDRIPRMPVNIQFTNQGVWNAFGVSGYGMPRYFILGNGMIEPADFPYIYGSATGFGGVLLISGQNPYTLDIGPLAYDLSCPVERDPNIRIYVDKANFDGICPDCGSHYNVVEAGGTPISGPAKTLGYGLRMYKFYSTPNGGYLISNF